LHAHFGTNPAAVALLCRVLGGPTYSFTVHGPEEFDHPSELSLGAKIESAAFVVAISDFGRSQLYRWCAPADWPKIHVVRCGVDDAFLRTHPEPPQGHRLVCVGRLCEQKGQFLLLQAVGRLVQERVPVELILAGDGPLRPSLEGEIDRLGLRNTVRMTGWLTNAQVREEMRQARAVVLPSFAEGLPVVLMEALALGRPVITTYVAGIPELVEHGIHGWLVPAGSLDALTDALRQALQAPRSALKALGTAGAARVAEQHIAGREAGKLATLFQALVRPGAGCRPGPDPASPYDSLPGGSSRVACH
jgi:glycosyltransferase involved in cell wall biosynthesis